MKTPEQQLHVDDLDPCQTVDRDGTPVIGVNGENICTYPIGKIYNTLNIAGIAFFVLSWLSYGYTSYEVLCLNEDFCGQPFNNRKNIFPCKEIALPDVGGPSLLRMLYGKVLPNTLFRFSATNIVFFRIFMAFLLMQKYQATTLRFSKIFFWGLLVTTGTEVLSLAVFFTNNTLYDDTNMSQIAGVIAVSSAFISMALHSEIIRVLQRHFYPVIILLAAIFATSAPAVVYQFAWVFMKVETRPCLPIVGMSLFLMEIAAFVSHITFYAIMPLALDNVEICVYQTKIDLNPSFFSGNTCKSRSTKELCGE